MGAGNHDSLAVQQKALTKRLGGLQMTTKPKLSLCLLVIAGFVVPFLNPLANARRLSPSQSTMTSGEASPPGGRILRTSSDRWVPPDIDDFVPPTSQSEGCQLEDIVQNAGLKMKQFVDDLEHFTATETITHQTVTRSGTLREPETQKYEYLVSVGASSLGPYIQEYRGRDLRQGPQPSSDGIKIQGVLNLGLVFHPSYANDYRMTCEGLGVWHGQPAWQIRFEELPTNRQPMINLSLPGKAFNLALRGRAWILADTYGLAGIETDLRQTLPEIRLKFDHEVVEYGLTLIPDHKTVLWLPLRTEVYMDFQHHRFYQSQTYTDLHLFSVDIRQDIDNPK